MSPTKHRNLPRGSADRETFAPIELPGSAYWMLRSLEGQVREIAEQVTERVHAAVPGLDGPEHEPLRSLVFSAIHSAIRLFVERALDRPVSAGAVEDKFRELGYAFAARGRGTRLIRQGMDTAVLELSNELRVRAASNELSAGALNTISDAVTSFVARLGEQVSIGYEAGAKARSTDAGLARVRLCAALLGGADSREIESQAAVAGWELPQTLTLLTVAVPKGKQLTDEVLGDAALSRPLPQATVVLCAEDQADAVIKRIRAAVRGTRIARCWPVAPEDLPSAATWAARALALVGAKVIPDRPVIDCVDYRTEIWLHAEPVLRRQLAQELLLPLLGESANSREILSETLLVWLETRDSAPAIAAQLGVHPQTVRYRWKRINELFGDSLHDPVFLIQMTMLLKASVPMWLVGDHSDFERFQASQEGA